MSLENAPSNHMECIRDSIAKNAIAINAQLDSVVIPKVVEEMCKMPLSHFTCLCVPVRIDTIVPCDRWNEPGRTLVINRLNDWGIPVRSVNEVGAKELTYHNTTWCQCVPGHRIDGPHTTFYFHVKDPVQDRLSHQAKLTNQPGAVFAFHTDPRLETEKGDELWRGKDPWMAPTFATRPADPTPVPEPLVALVVDPPFRAEYAKVMECEKPNAPVYLDVSPRNMQPEKAVEKIPSRFCVIS